jgi:uncharacterized protein involved in exopolysaccharide biosynthesis
MKKSASGKSGSTDRTLQEYVAVIMRGKWIILSVFGVVLLGTVLYTFFADPVYTCFSTR